MEFEPYPYLLMRLHASDTLLVLKLLLSGIKAAANPRLRDVLKYITFYVTNW